MELIQQTKADQVEWQGPTPVYLAIALAAGGIKIDLDEPRWATTYADYLRVPGLWMLTDKLTNIPLLMMTVAPDEQPYYTARHVGSTGAPREIVAYGIGKKLVGGKVDRLWLLPNGVVCGGDDVESIAIRMLRMMR
jgi:hypothetical protein